MMTRRQSRSDQGGFTIVEVIATLVVAGVFITAIYMLYGVQSRLSGTSLSYTNADRLAYNNLRTFANGRTPTWFTCTYASGSPQPVTLKSTSENVAGITSPVIQTVTATAPYGCGGGSSGMGYPIKVVSSVTYGSPGKTIVHATYATY